MELWERVEKEWEGIDATICQNLIESMPRRIEAIIKAKGGYTKYWYEFFCLWELAETKLFQCTIFSVSFIEKPNLCLQLQTKMIPKARKLEHKWIVLSCDWNICVICYDVIFARLPNIETVLLPTVPLVWSWLTDILLNPGIWLSNIDYPTGSHLLLESTRGHTEVWGKDDALDWSTEALI